MNDDNICTYFVLSFMFSFLGCYHLCYQLMLSFFTVSKVIIFRLSFSLVHILCYQLCYHLMLSFIVIISPLLSFSWKHDTLLYAPLSLPPLALFPTLKSTATSYHTVTSRDVNFCYPDSIRTYSKKNSGMWAWIFCWVFCAVRIGKNLCALGGRELPTFTLPTRNTINAPLIPLQIILNFEIYIPSWLV